MVGEAGSLVSFLSCTVPPEGARGAHSATTCRWHGVRASGEPGSGESARGVCVHRNFRDEGERSESCFGDMVSGEGPELAGLGVEQERVMGR